MLKHLLGIPQEEMPRLMDATDALAVALTHYYETGKPAIAKGPKNWADFIARNPDRIVKRKKKSE